MKILDLFCRSAEFRHRLEESRNRLYRVAYSWCHDPDLADDLAQEALSKALKNGKQLRDPKALDTWLFRILNNCWHDFLRRRKEQDEFDEERYEHHDSPEVLNSRRETIERVQGAVAQLSSGQREVLTLVDLEGFSYVEVAEILDIPIGTVMSRLCRARRALADQLLVAPGSACKRTGRLRRVK